MANAHYAWCGVNRQGQVVEGEMLADAPEAVTQHLRQQRIRVTRIQRHYKLPVWLRLQAKPSARPRDITQFTRQLATLLHAGVPLLQAFHILERGESKATVKTLIQTLHRHIEGGIALNQALREHAQFDDLYCNLVAVGELAGMLDTMLTRLANHLEKSEALRATLRSALVYPVAVLGIATTVLALILVFVVPAFQNIFASFGAELPWMTRGVIVLSEGLQHHGIWLLVALGLLAWWLPKQIKQRASWQRYWHSALLRTPIAGSLTRHACTARWTRTLATLFAAGVPLTEALAAVQGITGHMLFQAATQSIQHQLIQGRALSQALESTQGLFPHMVSQMCAIGEESGTLDHMLEKTAEHYEREVDYTVARLSTLLEPVIMVVLGLLIGGLVMALYLPIFQLGQVV
jgi:type IV pilus assembly protein PilC